MTDESNIDPLDATLGAELAETAGLSDTARHSIRKDAELRAGTSLEHFEIIGLLGKGAMGAVYHAHDTSLDRPVAIKVLPPHLSEDDTFIERFVREARAQAMLSHPNVVPIYFIGQAGKRWFFAMEKIEGESLGDPLERNETLAWNDALDVAEAVASALGMAQEKGLIHRDIKPSNILRSSEGAIKVADFGLAKPVSEMSKEEKQLTQEGAFVGTPLYVAPEQARGEDLDHRVDMYALGATLFHLVAGEPVFDGDSLVAIVAKHAGEPPPLHKLDGSPDFRALVGRLLEKRPNDRFQSWEDVLRAVDEARPREDRPGAMSARYFANFVDGMLAILLAEFLLPEEFEAAFALFLAIYVIVGTQKFGTTLGKWLFRLRVIDSEGGQPSLWQSTVRTLLTWIPAWMFAGLNAWIQLSDLEASGDYSNSEILDAPVQIILLVVAVFALPVIMAIIAFAASRNRDKMTYADKIAGTRVLQKN